MQYPLNNPEQIPHEFKLPNVPQDEVDVDRTVAAQVANVIQPSAGADPGYVKRGAEIQKGGGGG